MIEGPGLGVTARVTVCPVPSSSARIRSGPSAAPTLATQRILLFLLATGGAARGCCATHTMATMSPLSLRTYGTDGLGSEKPVLAHGGRTLDGYVVRQAAAGGRDVVDGAVAVGLWPAAERELPEPSEVHPARANATSRLNAIRVIRRGYADSSNDGDPRRAIRVPARAAIRPPEKVCPSAANPAWTSRSSAGADGLLQERADEVVHSVRRFVGTQVRGSGDDLEAAAGDLRGLNLSSFDRDESVVRTDHDENR